MYLSFDWRQAPDAEVHTMSVLFFPSDESTSSWRYEMSADADSARVPYLPAATYDAIAYNPGASHVMFASDEERGDLCAYCLPLTKFVYDDGADENSLPARAQADEQEIIRTVGAMWVGRTAGIVVPDLLAEDVFVEISPASVTPFYSYEVLDIEHPENISAAGAVLSGMSGRVYLWSGARSDVPVSLSLPLSRTDEDIIGEFHTFGPCTLANIRHVLYLYFHLKDGRKYYQHFDVTDQIRSAPDPFSVHIKVSGVTIPAPDKPIDPGTGESGFEVGVDGWITTLIPIVS